MIFLMFLTRSQSKATYANQIVRLKELFATVYKVRVHKAFLRPCNYLLEKFEIQLNVTLYIFM